MTDRILRLPELRERLGLPRSSVYWAIKRGVLPKPIRCSPRTSGWPESEINAVVALRVAGKPEDEIRGIVAAMEAARSEAA